MSWLVPITDPGPIPSPWPSRPQSDVMLPTAPGMAAHVPSRNVTGMRKDRRTDLISLRSVGSPCEARFRGADFEIGLSGGRAYTRALAATPREE